MINETYMGYAIQALPMKTRVGKWTVAVVIEKEYQGKTLEKKFYAEDNIQYILEIEAAKESINLGKNLINSSLVGF